jgi:hypothetical protein
LIDTIAMIGSPASRGAVASMGGAWRTGLAVALPLGAVSAAVVASAIIAGAPQRRIVTTVINRCPMLRPVECLSVYIDRVPDRDFRITNSRRNLVSKTTGTFDGDSFILRESTDEEGGGSRQIGGEPAA